MRRWLPSDGRGGDPPTGPAQRAAPAAGHVTYSFLPPEALDSLPFYVFNLPGHHPSPATHPLFRRHPSLIQQIELPALAF